MSSSARRSSRRATVVSTMASNAPMSLPPSSPTPTVGAGVTLTPSTPTATVTPTKTSTEIIKEATIANCPLYLECEDDVLTIAQKTFHTKKMKAFQEQMVKLENLSKLGARIQPQKDGSVIFRTTETTTSAPVPGTPGSLQPQMPTHPQIQGGVRLVLDPKTGRILGTINGNNQQHPTGTTTVVRAPGMPGMRMPGMPQLLARAPQPPVVTPINRMTPTRPVTSPAVVDLARAQSGSAAGGGSSASGRNKGFPALAMQPKPQKAPPPSNSRRPELDAKVKSLLVLTPAKFTEWLIQNGLVPVEQYEVVPGKGKTKLKLGMYNDPTKFPNSGGYVWISEANSTKFTSVFRGSIFEATNHEPIIVLKLLYHWSCQTNITNVLTWVKVDNATVDLYYRNFRAVCTAAVHDEIVNMGGNGKTVEIGVISLGTTTSDGNKREVRVEVLGVLDRATGLVRLRATEPIVGASQAERFTKIFEPMPIWVQRNTKIITDFSVDKDRLYKLGYTQIVQCNVQSKRAEASNSQIMDYLKGVVPKMFQNSLSHLTTNVIQQFLDELTFRESFGLYPLLCFENLIQRLATQTSAATLTPVQLVSRLKNIADNPYQDWRINKPESSHIGISSLPAGLQSVSSPYGSSGASAGKRGASDFEDIDEQISKKFKVASELVDLESYFYATLQGDMEVLSGEFKADMAFKCHLCKKVYMNNIEFMKHLSLHVETDRASAVDLADLCQCKYCYKEFDTPYAMQSHLEEVHLKKGSEFVCRICDEGFGVKNHLIHHMSKTHAKSEMPYLCQICGYRSSMHRDLIDHFQESHDRTDKLQCPRCLKTYSLFSDKGYNSSVASSFVSHLQMHQDKKVSCKKCCLTFHNEQSLKSHVDKDHVSFKSFDNLDIYQYGSNEEPIKMPKPDERNSRTAARKSGLIKTPAQQSAFAAQNLEDMVMYDVERDDNCGECGRKFNLPGHYTAYLCCTKCRYSTCCSKAISVHVALFHGAAANPIYNLGTPVLLEKDIFCCCGFKTNSGNKMAKHLGSHGCKSAYPSAESAAKAVRALSSASFAPLIALDEGEAVDPSVAMAKAYCKEKKEDEKEKKSHEGPLAFLGLQRKSVDAEPKEESKTDVDEDRQNEAESMEVDAKEKKENEDEQTADQKDGLSSQSTEESGQTEEQKENVTKSDDNSKIEEENEGEKKEAPQSEAEHGPEDAEGVEKQVLGDEETEEKREEVEQQTEDKEEVENENTTNESNEPQNILTTPEDAKDDDDETIPANEESVPMDQEPEAPLDDEIPLPEQELTPIEPEPALPSEQESFESATFTNNVAQSVENIVDQNDDAMLSTDLEEVLNQALGETVSQENQGSQETTETSESGFDASSSLPMDIGN